MALVVVHTVLEMNRVKIYTVQNNYIYIHKYAKKIKSLTYKVPI